MSFLVLSCQLMPQPLGRLNYRRIAIQPVAYERTGGVLLGF